MKKTISNKKLRLVRKNLHQSETIALHIVTKFLKHKTPLERVEWLQDTVYVGCLSNPDRGLCFNVDIWRFHKKHQENIDEILDNMCDGIIFNSGVNYLTHIAHFAFQEVSAYLLGELT